MKKTALALMTLSALAAGERSGLPESFVIHPKPGSFPGWQSQPTGPTDRFVLGLGDAIESTVVEVVPRPGEHRELTVQFQVETSMTLMDDGPHLDLLDWKHGTSDWTDLERIGPARFRMPSVEATWQLATEFPDYTPQELYDTALAAGGERWAELVRQWPDPEDGRIAVAISTVRLRILAEAPAGRETVFTVEIGVPMGC